MSIIDAKHFHDEKAAYRFLEAQVWPDGPVCPHCGGFDRIGKLEGESTRIGVYKCYDCRKPFSVKVGTVFESSHIPLHKWLQAAFLLCSSKKGISSNQLARTLQITLKSAWFMSHRLREAMRDTSADPLGGQGKAVESDETYFGRKKGAKVKQSGAHKHIVLSLIERGGKARSFHVKDSKAATLGPILATHIDKASTLMTDTATHYRPIAGQFAKHETVNHLKKEYARGDVHVNSAEGFFNVFKRGMVGTYQHCGEQHLHRYLSEFDFRYNNRQALGVDDGERTIKALRGVMGKRLTYGGPREATKA
jgi:transposase-like protein